MQQAPIPPTPPGTTAPVTAPAAVTVDGTVLSNPQAQYQAFRAQRRELTRQMENLQETRRSLSERLRSDAISEAEKKGLEQRIQATDERIAAMDKSIADADAQIARTAAIPGAAVEPQRAPETGVDEGVYIVSTVLVIFVLMPIALSYARRIWRSSAKVITTFPKELSDRLMRVEQAVESTALEVERIGEGQRFMTKLFTEGPAPQALRGQSNGGRQEQAALLPNASGSPQMARKESHEG